MRKQPTEEQKRKAAERRERLKAIAKRVAAMKPEERMAMIGSIGAIPTIEGRALSFFNSCFVLSQMPNASMVGGFRQWKAHGRSVMKGATGLGIWCPLGKSKSAEGDAPAASDLDGEERGRPRFMIGTVFDITQTCAMDDAEAVAELAEAV